VAFDGAAADVLLAPDAACELVFAEVCGELDEQLKLQAAEADILAGDVHRSCGEVDVDLADVQMAAGDRLVCAACERGEDCSQQQVSGAVGEVVIAAALIGAQDGQLVVGAERDDRLAGVDAGVLVGADGSQEPGGVCGVLEIAEDQHVDRLLRQPCDRRQDGVGLVDGVPVGVQLRGKKRPLSLVTDRS
jgi:hypothetical protein